MQYNAEYKYNSRFPCLAPNVGGKYSTFTIVKLAVLYLFKCPLSVLGNNLVFLDDRLVFVL